MRELVSTPAESMKTAQPEFIKNKEGNHMWMLLGSTVATSFLDSLNPSASFFDSLNPSAIAQQMLLQAMVKNKRHIWFFIGGIGSANLILGLAVYYGIAAWVSALFSQAVERYPQHIYGAALGAGMICLLAGFRLIARKKRQANNAQAASEVKAPAQLTPLSLFLLGGAFCAIELTSAFPYFGFLAILASYRFMFPFVLLFMMIYSFVYTLPLILLYFGYQKLQGTAILIRIERMLSGVAGYVVPVVVVLCGAFLCYFGINALL